MKLKLFFALGLFMFNSAAGLQAQTEKPVAKSKDGKGEVVVSGELKQH